MNFPLVSFFLINISPSHQGRNLALKAGEGAQYGYTSKALELGILFQIK